MTKEQIWMETEPEVLKKSTKTTKEWDQERSKKHQREMMDGRLAKWKMTRENNHLNRRHFKRRARKNYFVDLCVNKFEILDKGFPRKIQFIKIHPSEIRKLKQTKFYRRNRQSVKEPLHKERPGLDGFTSKPSKAIGHQYCKKIVLERKKEGRKTSKFFFTKQI